MYRSADFCRAVLECMVEPVLVTDAELLHPGPRIVYVNPAFEAVTGYSAAEVIGLTPRILQGPRTSDDVIARLRTCLEKREPFEGQTINYRKDGSEYVNCWRVRPIQLDGRPFFLSIQTDITEERRFVALANATATFESAAYMLAGIRHELGNPVNSIKAALTLLRDHVHTLPAARVDHYLAALMREVGRVERLLSGLRTLNAFENPRPSEVNIAAAVASVRPLVAPLLQQHKFRWASDVPPDATAFVDAQSLHQILLNAVKNALEAMAEQAEGAIRLSWDSDERILRVSDNGPGMSSTSCENLFRPFFTSKDGGSGLGLYVARRLAHDMGCELRVETALGSGTSVLLTMPRTFAPIDSTTTP